MKSLLQFGRYAFGGLLCYGGSKIFFGTGLGEVPAPTGYVATITGIGLIALGLWLVFTTRFDQKSGGPSGPPE